MNQKLKELMINHGLHKHMSEDCQHRMEMLYELIVRECVWIVDNDGSSEDILEHFGVE